MLGDDNQEQKIEYQNRCGRHATFYDGCGQCLGNATEEFLYSKAHGEAPSDTIEARKPYKPVGKWASANHDLKEGDKVVFSGVKHHDIIDEQPTKEFVVGPLMSVQEFADVVKQGIEHANKLDEGVKFDDDKPRYDLIPARPLEELAKVYTVGAKKYADRNWEKGLRWGRVFAAMMRHAWAWWMGETNDKESGVHHMAAVAWGAFALIEYSQTNKGQDDRLVERAAESHCFILHCTNLVGGEYITAFAESTEAVKAFDRERESGRWSHIRIRNLADDETFVEYKGLGD